MESTAGAEGAPFRLQSLAVEVVYAAIMPLEIPWQRQFPEGPNPVGDANPTGNLPD